MLCRSTPILDWRMLQQPTQPQNLFNRMHTVHSPVKPSIRCCLSTLTSFIMSSETGTRNCESTSTTYSRRGQDNFLLVLSRMGSSVGLSWVTYERHFRVGTLSGIYIATFSLAIGSSYTDKGSKAPMTRRWIRQAACLTYVAQLCITQALSRSVNHRAILITFRQIMSTLGLQDGVCSWTPII